MTNKEIERLLRKENFSASEITFLLTMAAQGQPEASKILEAQEQKMSAAEVIRLQQDNVKVK